MEVSLCGGVLKIQKKNEGPIWFIYLFMSASYVDQKLWQLSNLSKSQPLIST
jgi:hypothetical protein